MPSGLLVPILLPSTLTPLILPSSSVSLTYFILAVLMHARVVEKARLHEFHISYIVMLSGTFFFAL